MATNIKFKVDDKAVRKALSVAPRAIVEAINLSLRRTAVYTQRCFRQNMPAGTTGNLRRSVTYKFLNKVTVQVEPSAKYADYVEHGTRPHWTSVRNLERWANLKGINPYALQHSIAKHGTRPHPYLHKTTEQASSFLQHDLPFHINDVIERYL